LTVRYGILQNVSVYYNVSQYISVCYNVLQFMKVYCGTLLYITHFENVYIVLQYITMNLDTFQCVIES